MKQLTILLMLISTMLQAQSTRFLYIKDGIAIDTKEAQISSEERFDFLFDKYGKWEVPDTPLPNITLGKSDSLQKVYMIMTFDEFTNLNVPKFLNWTYSRKELIPQFVNGGLLDYGRVRALKYHDPGEYTINAWQPEYIYYSSSWNIPTSTSGGCKCSFQKEPKIGDYVEIPFNGTGIKIIGEKVYTHGIVNIELNGQIVKNNVDLFAPDSLSVNPFTVYEVSNLQSKQHVVKIEVIGKNPSSTNYYLVLHKFEVTNKMSDNVIISDTLFTRQDTVYIEKIVHDTVYVDSIEPTNDVVISQHSDIKEAYEKVTGSHITRKGYYQVFQRPDSSLYIKQPDIDIK